MASPCCWEAIWLIAVSIMGTCLILAAGQLLEGWLAAREIEDQAED
jgi:hypothetical protein